MLSVNIVLQLGLQKCDVLSLLIPVTESPCSGIENGKHTVIRHERSEYELQICSYKISDF